MYDDVIGVKTGFTKKSGRCLVSASKKEGKFVIAVTLNDGNDWQDHRTLLDLGLSAITSKTFSPKLNTVTLDVVNGEKLYVNIPSMTFSTTKNSVVDYAINLPRFLYPPIKKGEVLGEICYYCNGNLLCELSITSPQDINLKNKKAVVLFQIFKSIILTA